MKLTSKLIDQVLEIVEDRIFSRPSVDIMIATMALFEMYKAQISRLKDHDPCETQRQDFAIYLKALNEYLKETPEEKTYRHLFKISITPANHASNQNPVSRQRNQKKRTI